MPNKATLTGPLPDYWENASRLPFEKVELEHRNSPTRHLSPVERATVRITAPAPQQIPAGFSILHEAAVRLSIFQSRGVLPYASGAWVANTLECVFFWPHLTRGSRKGWTLLHALDEADLEVKATLSAEPLEPFGAFRRMRLHERLTEIEAPPNDTDPPRGKLDSARIGRI